MNIITYNRPASLQRLVSSLLAAHYHGDTVHLRVFVDVPRGEAPSAPTLAFVESFEWPHGEKKLVVRMKNVSIDPRLFGVPPSLCVCHSSASVCLSLRVCVCRLA